LCQTVRSEGKKARSEASPEIWLEAIRQLLSNVASGKLRIDTERVPLREVEDAWQRDQHGWRTPTISTEYNSFRHRNFPDW
jgi:hypothetical protein